MMTLTVIVFFCLWTASCGETLKYRSLASGSMAPLSYDVECDFPPSVWCSSKEIARRCQVERQCERSVWGASRRQGSEAGRVNFTLYLESLCPDCKMYVTDTLWPAWNKLSSIMNLQVVPYGNAMEMKDGNKWKFDCQHGPNECVGNVIETCAIFLLGNNATKYFPFIHCIEESDNLPVTEAVTCAKKLGIDYAPIEKCMTGPLGNALEHKMAEKTDQLNPKHTFVPWVTLNGVHTDDIQQQAITNLVGLICDTYKGIKPAACKKQLNVHRKRKH